MMALRIRVLQYIVLTVVSVLLVAVYSYYANFLHFCPIEQPEEKTIHDLTKQTSEVSGKTKEIHIPELWSEKVASKPIVVKKILLKGKVKTPNKSKGGFLAQSIYTAGHNISAAELCSELGVKLRVIIMITSAPDHSAARMAIRQTWGHFALRKDVAIAFCVGVTSKPQTASKIWQEAETYGDIVQGNFIDSYDNLTLKTISILEWIDNYCPSAKFILKTDDDMFINVPKLLEFIDSHNKTQQTIFGFLAIKWTPNRDPTNKYYVPLTQFSAPFFPDFTTGPAYLLTRDIVHELYHHALNTTYMKLEDVFTTGIVAHSLNINRVHKNEFLHKKIIPFNMCNFINVISIHGVERQEQFDLWRNYLMGEQTVCESFSQGIKK